MLLTVTTPLLARGGKAAADWLFKPSNETFAERLAEVRERTEREVESALGTAKEATGGAAGPGAKTKGGPGGGTSGAGA